MPVGDVRMITFEVTLRDGTVVPAEVDVSDFSDLDAQEAALAGVLAGPGGLINAEGEVDPTPEGVAAFLFVKVRRQVPDLPADDWPEFRDQILMIAAGEEEE